MRAYRQLWTHLGVAAIYATAMAVVEATVVYYLRKLFALQYAAVFTDGFHFPPAYLRYEQTREIATIVMLLAVAYLAGRGWWQRLAYFLFMFGLWDIAYYVALKMILDWPASLATRDLLFLVPSPWWGPVWQPILASCAFIAVAILLLARTQRR